MEIYAVIMAGGVGSRFWPRSKEKTPKQLIKIIGENTMIQDTVYRLKGLVEPEKIIIITNQIQKLRIKEQLPEVPSENIIAEPFGKNTAACIGLAAALIEKKNKDAVMLSLPADHIITDTVEFQKTIKCAIEFAFNSKGLVTVGIKPTKPETGYGYIQFDETDNNDNIYKVLTFAEKPNYSTAERFLSSGDFLWNSGMFIWRVDAILDEIKNYMPDLSLGLDKLKPTIDTNRFDKELVNVYGQLKSISIDYGIMENSTKVFVTKGDFFWNDVGNWDAVYDMSEKSDDGNAAIGDVFTDKTFNSYIYSPNKFTAVIGEDNLIVIDTDDALLICNRNNSQDVRNVVDYLKFHKKNDLI